MARAQRPPKYLHVGIDVSQRTLEVAFRTPDGEVSGAAFANDDGGIRDLVRLVKAGRKRRRVLVEATGVYGLNLCFALHEASIELMVANPLATRRFAEAQGRRAKNDRVDARMLLEFAERMSFTPWTPPSHAICELRSLAGRVQSLVELRTADLNRYHAAKLDPKTPSAVLQDIEEGIENLEARIDKLLVTARQLMKSTPEIEEAHRILTSVPGIADRSALQILAHLLILPEDMTPKQVAAFAGLDPHTVESGTSVHGPAHISRRGAASLRGALYMPVLVGIRYSPAIAAAYNALLERGKPKKVAQVAVMRRLLGATWQMLRQKKPWDAKKFGHAQLPA